MLTLVPPDEDAASRQLKVRKPLNQVTETDVVDLLANYRVASEASPADQRDHEFLPDCPCCAPEAMPEEVDPRQWKAGGAMDDEADMDAALDGDLQFQSDQADY